MPEKKQEQKEQKGRKKGDEQQRASEQRSEDQSQSRSEETQGGSGTTDPGLPDGDLPLEGEESQPGESRQTLFNHATLRDRSPQEVEAYVKLLEGTVNEQKRHLTEVQSPQSGHAQRQEAPAEEEPTAQDYWKDPVTANKRIFQRMLEETIAPFKQDLAKTQEMQLRDELRQELPNFSQYEPYIDQMLQSGRFGSRVNKDLLRTLYFTARGYVAEHGGVPTSNPSQRTDNREGNMGQGQRVPSTPPPQHRPSSTPLPDSSGDGEKKLRALTENEERLRREWGMSKEEYLELQDAPADTFMHEGGSQND